MVRQRLKNSIGKQAKIILYNGFAFYGIITGCDENYLELVLDNKKGYKIILLTEVNEFEIKEKLE